MGNLQVREKEEIVYLIFNCKGKKSTDDLIKQFQASIGSYSRNKQAIQSQFTNCITKEEWIKSITKCTEIINRGEIEKVVLARSIEMHDDSIVNKNLDIYNYLQKRFENNYYLGDYRYSKVFSSF